MLNIRYSLAGALLCVAMVGVFGADFIVQWTAAITGFCSFYAWLQN